MYALAVLMRSYIYIYMYIGMLSVLLLSCEGEAIWEKVDVVRSKAAKQQQTMISDQLTPPPAQV